MLLTRNGHDWSGRLPLITEAALHNKSSSFVVDGEAVLLGVDGASDFGGLHSRQHDDEVQFYAFDMLVSDGEDIRKLPLSMRKANLSPAAGRDGPMASLPPRLSRARSAQTYSARRASSGLRGLFQSIASEPTGPAHRRTGSRSRI